MAGANGRAGLLPLRCNPDPNRDDALRQHNADVEYNADGVPIVLHFRCRNRECCPRATDDYGVHLYTLWGVQNGVEVGEYVTVRRKFGSFADMPVAHGLRAVHK